MSGFQWQMPVTRDPDSDLDEVFALDSQSEYLLLDVLTIDGQIRLTARNLSERFLQISQMLKVSKVYFLSGNKILTDFSGIQNHQSCKNQVRKKMAIK